MEFFNPEKYPESKKNRLLYYPQISGIKPKSVVYMLGVWHEMEKRRRLKAADRKRGRWITFIPGVKHMGIERYLRWYSVLYCRKIHRQQAPGLNRRYIILSIVLEKRREVS